MAEPIIAYPAHPVPATEGQPEGELEYVSTLVPGAFPLRLSARLQRGITLAEERFEEIERIAPYVWSVPSRSRERRYLVDLKHTSCTCPDRPPEGERCLHVSAAAWVKAKTAPCSGCGQRFRHRNLFEVQESLTYFPGDLLCHECWQGSDAEVL